MLLIITFISIVTAKCGLWRQYNRDTQRDGPYFNGNPGSWSRTAWAFSYGFESLDQNLACNDMEMFYQCDRAQKYLDLYNAEQNIAPATVSCAQNIVCSGAFTENGRFWCQNMNSFDLCVSVQSILNATKYSVECTYATANTDGIPILNYRRSPEITSTTTVTTTSVFVPTFVPSPTTIPQTTRPSTGHFLAPGIIFLVAMAL